MPPIPKRRLHLKTYDGAHHLSYLELAAHPHELVSGIVKNTVSIHELIPDYIGPQLKLNFDERGEAIGIEILYPYDYFYDDDELEHEDDR